MDRLDLQQRVDREVERRIMNPTAEEKRLDRAIKRQALWARCMDIVRIATPTILVLLLLRQAVLASAGCGGSIAGIAIPSAVAGGMFWAAGRFRWTAMRQKGRLTLASAEASIALNEACDALESAQSDDEVDCSPERMQRLWTVVAAKIDADVRAKRLRWAVAIVALTLSGVAAAATLLRSADSSSRGAVAAGVTRLRKFLCSRGDE